MWCGVRTGRFVITAVCKSGGVCVRERERELPGAKTALRRSYVTRTLRIRVAGLARRGCYSM